MKHLSYLVPHLPTPKSGHAKACMERIKAILAKPQPQPEPEPVERIPGEDREEDDAQPV